MMSPEAQLTSNRSSSAARQIIVSYPTDTMEYDARMQSMRGNNTRLLARDGVPRDDSRPQPRRLPRRALRRLPRRDLGGGTPFFGEGWPLYWELTLYDLGFHETPEERVGALFWRMHRCARIIFSLNFHMGQWSPQESIDFLVDKVGHERDNATAEVRRSFQGGYGPLYQAAYLLGGLQLRGLRKELVDSRQMTEQAVPRRDPASGQHADRAHPAGLTKQKLTRDMSIDWKFYGDLPAQ